MIQVAVFLLLFVSTQIFAGQYDKTIIYIESKIFPKVTLLEESVKNSTSTYLHIGIITKTIDLEIAHQFAENIKSIYPNLLRNKSLVITITQFSNSIQNKPDAIIVLNHSKEEIEEIASWANNNKILSFSYDPFYMQYGLVSSIYIGKTTKPYLNKQAIKKYDFSFDPYLMNLSKFKN